MNVKIVKDLLDLIKDSDVVELEWTPDSVRIVRNSNAKIGITSRNDIAHPSKDFTKEKPTVTVTSPLVGTFYRSASSETQPFVQVGDRVTKGQTLCVIEAMKLMNEIEAHVDGIVTAILKQDGEKVGYGDPLFIIEEL
ncbi:MAG: acetyl-CoA carboxylase, biotin carboxyl carrier protein [Deltaproteobacteria bacterium]|nr:acetyl-CoA carboxylase, biotin carboxyl carrier protein [Deltaproteobacteria bacterium]